ncbi:MAG: menaquinone biosynthesis decarboxylase [Bacteroidales bacterium]|nr:menaquinone biosynthesis decarboxylase [Bacteroidales bacterium]
MAYSGLTGYIADLEKHGELHRIKPFVNPVLEIAEITDRVTKNGGKALLFENTGTNFPVLINAFGSDKRMAMAIGREDTGELEEEILSLFNNLLSSHGTLFKKLLSLPDLARLTGFLPSRTGRKGICQQVIYRNPDLDILPVLKCWPYDGGRFITLPMVHTVDPVSGNTNVGMYRMQILGKNTTAMHWQRHKTGANHFEAWKKYGGKMPVSVVLGGDPVYTYSATAPLPENISEYILAGFLRKKRVSLVKCITNELYVPFDADIVLEGYVDPSEEFIYEGPFGDHTGFYSLADWYPKFHVTCITHSKKAVYPAIIVGIPPQEDALLTRATERIFLSPLKLALQPEIEDFHMPVAGIAHNLVIVKIKKTYPGQGMKVLSSLFGAGQMMFTKYLVVVSGNVNIRDYRDLLRHVFENASFKTDLLFGTGPLDVLDHSSEKFSFGGKLGIDSTVKLKEESENPADNVSVKRPGIRDLTGIFAGKINIPASAMNILSDELPVLVVAFDQLKNSRIIEESKKRLAGEELTGIFRLILAVDNTVDINDFFTVAWQVLGNSDPQRDIEYIFDNTIFIDGTIKAYRTGGFPRKWPNVVCSSHETINIIDQKWGSLGIGPFIPSPSIKNSGLIREGDDELIVKKA